MGRVQEQTNNTEDKSITEDCVTAIERNRLHTGIDVS